MSQEDSSTTTSFRPLVYAVNAIQDASHKRSFETFLENIRSSHISELFKRKTMSLFSSNNDSSDEDLHKTLYVRKQDEDRSSRYAQHLPEPEFFETARIVSVSERYGCPPSRDSTGMDNLAFAIHGALKGRGSSADKEAAARQVFEHFPQHGIVGSGWLEKHVHALPSVIVVVIRVSTRDQAVQDRKLFDCIQHLQYSLVEKRQCTVQIVGILADDISDEQAAIWSRTIRAEVESSHLFVTTVRNHTEDENLRSLHRSIRDASLQYYLKQAGRFKEKIQKLVVRRGPPDSNILFLLIRYCFKIGVFYEFQMKREKSLQFLNLAYKYTTEYYAFLLSERPPEEEAEESPESSPSKPPHSMVSVEGESIEISNGSSHTSGSSSSFHWSRVVPEPPSDIVHQCRGVADWLNEKLLQSGLSSGSEGGLLAASNQWRTHCRMFAVPLEDLKMPKWFEWQYITKQRTQFANLVHAHPPTVLGNGHEYDETNLRFSAWRAHESAAQSTLQLARALEEYSQSKAIKEMTAMDQSERSDVPRARFIGGLVSDDLLLDYQQAKGVNHRQAALELILKAISIFEKEQETLKQGFYAEDDFGERSSSRTGARLYYFAGGVLLGMGRHQESAEHLSKASHCCRGWRELELAVRRMLIECYEKHIPSESDVHESNQNLVSMILDSYFNAEMSSQDLRKALDHFSQMSGGNKLQWHHATQDEDDPSLPFSFAVSFPGKTHATCGDTVACSLMIKSNLDYAVQVNSVAMTSLAGKLDVPKNDLLSAVNASEGANGGIIIQAKTAIIVTTTVDLPKDVSMIAFDESGNGGELLGVAGKGSFAKNAKPRSAGITSAGGARLVSEDALEKGNESSGGWNVRFLGGKPLLCDGLQLVFYPVQAEASGMSSNVTLIELQIEKKKRRTAANIKRTPFEEENYIASAWSRPLEVPFSRGPRSLRVLAPLPELVVTNVTEELTKGKALEGTVNRILLQLQAGPEEQCSDMKISVSCFSVLVTPAGATKRLVSEQEIQNGAEENSLNMNLPSYRTPMLVQPCSDCSSQSKGFGYDLPQGWGPCGSGSKKNQIPVPSLKNGETGYVYLDLFRPAALSDFTNGLDSSEGQGRHYNVGDVSMCKTDFYVTLAYNQKRPAAFKQKSRRRRSARKRPVMSRNSSDDQAPSNATDGDSVDESTDAVSLEFSGSVSWATPINAEIAKGSPICYPSGSFHASNKASIRLEANGSDLLVVDKEAVSLRCSLQIDSTCGCTNAEIVSVRYKDDKSPQCTLKTRLLRETERNLIYNATPEDPCRFLSEGSTIQTSYSVLPSLKDSIVERHSTARLGYLLVDWRPCPLKVSTADDFPGVEAAAGTAVHGPLVLSEPSTMRFPGPRCHVERTPFTVKVVTSPACPVVGVPFEVAYTVTNNTNQHQAIYVQVKNAAENSDWLMSGRTSGKLDIGPNEQQRLLFLFIATRPGGMALPQLKVSTDRFDSWIINEEQGKKLLNVMP